ncbi:MAG: hypothetical protein QHH25_06280 [Candidatus Acetothermia bacterium]|nr:hypothetical protein [Candidatus Acetothermia bacterium]
MQKLSWLALVLITLLTAYFAYETDANYLEFIRATEKIEVIIHAGELSLNKDKAEISFFAEVINSSPVPMWVEAISYHFYIDGQRGGYGYMEEARRGEITVAPGQARKIPLEAELRADYLKLFLQAREEGDVLVSITGQARTGFDVGRSGIKAFYPVSGVIWREETK